MYTRIVVKMNIYLITIIAKTESNQFNCSIVFLRVLLGTSSNHQTKVKPFVLNDGVILGWFA